MMDENLNFEVEIRCRFDTHEEATGALPFLQSCLDRGTRYSWHTGIYGRQIFESGCLLRAGQVTKSEGITKWLGWKSADLGSFANIRQEIDEDFTSGISGSAILKRLGGREHLDSADAVLGELERLGHYRFMDFGGDDISGYEDSMGLSVKLMNCSFIKWPLIVELEMSATTMADALRRENDLYELCRRLNLENRLVKQEPPTLLYASFPGGR